MINKFIEHVLTESGDFVLVVNTDGEIISTGQTLRRFLGMNAEGNIELSGDEPVELYLPKSDGSGVEIEFSVCALDEINLLTAKDDTCEKLLKIEKEDCARKERKYHILLDGSSDPIFSFYPDGTYMYVNNIFAATLNTSKENIIGKKIWDFFPGEEGDKRFATVKHVCETGKPRDIEVCVTKPDGNVYFLTTATPVKTDDGRVDFVICISKNITELKKAREDIEKMAFYDGLLNIPNKRYFNDYFEKEWKRASRENIPISILMADIDNFKMFNDAKGHIKGDVCLVEIAKIISGLLERPGDFVARFGGEEFICVLPNTNSAGAVEVAEAIRDAVESMGITSKVGGRNYPLTISIGVNTAVPSFESDSLDSMRNFINNADKAVYTAKANGRNMVVSYKAKNDQPF